MKKLLTILLVLITSIGYSQTIDTVRIPIGGFGGGTDTTSLSNRINSKLAIADTSAMLYNYITGINTNASNISANQAAILLKLPISDTAGMLANYQTQININTSHIATNTSNIASNTSAIAGKQNTLTLTTTGTSGTATLTGSTLNIPNYATGGGIVADSSIFINRKYLPYLNAQMSKLKTSVPSNLKIAFIGDSWTYSYGFTNPVKTYLQRLYGDGGNGYSTYNSTILSSNGVTISATGTWTDNTLYNYGASLFYSTSSSTGATKVAVSAGTDFIIHYLKNSVGGSFSVSIDGVIADTVSTTNASDLAGFYKNKTSLTYPGTHTVTVTIISGTITLMGIDFQVNQASASGVRVYNLGNTGATAYRWLTPAENVWDSAINALAPNLTVITLAVNEESSNTTPATYKANLDSLIHRVKRAYPYTSILLNTPADILDTFAYPMSSYVAQMRALADADSIGMLNNYIAMAKYDPADPYSLYSGSAHLNNNGYNIIANNIIGYITSIIPPPYNSYFPFAITGNSFGIGPNNPNSSNLTKQTTAAVNNTAIGYSSQTNVTSGNNNTSNGYNTLATLTTGSNNTGVGSTALQNGNGSNNTAVGMASQYTGTGGNNASLGYASLYSNTGTNNIGIGYFAGRNLTSGQYNSFIGSNSGYTSQLATVNYSSVLGGNAYTTGDYAIAIGYNQHSAAGEVRIGDPNGHTTNTYLYGKLTLINSSSQGSYFTVRPPRGTGDSLGIASNVQNDSAFLHKTDSLDMTKATGVLGISHMAQTTITLLKGIKATVTGDTLFTAPHVYSQTSNATLTIDTDTTDLAILTAQAAALTIANTTGNTPYEGQSLMIRIKDNGTAQTISFGSMFRFGSNSTAPTTTTISKVMYMDFRYDAISNTWDMISPFNNF